MALPVTPLPLSPDLVPRWLWPTRVVGGVFLLLSLGVQARSVLQESIAAMPKASEEKPQALRPSMVYLPVGRFQMGSGDDDAEASLDEKPRHWVEITKRFGLSETEVTQSQYEAVMGTNPSHFRKADDAGDRPVENVSWLDAVAYCNRLSEREGLEACYAVSGDQVKWVRGLDCLGYRLPTEAEWEYAARADQGTKYAGSNEAEKVAWFGEGIASGSTHAVKKKAANQWGLYDLSGNVWEWVWDEWKDSYAGAAWKDPTGSLEAQANGSGRVLRGGSWAIVALRVRGADRSWDVPGYRNLSQGFRLSRSSP